MNSLTDKSGFEMCINGKRYEYFPIIFIIQNEYYFR